MTFSHRAYMVPLICTHTILPHRFGVITHVRPESGADVHDNSSVSGLLHFCSMGPMHSGGCIHSMIVVMFYMYQRRLARETGQLSTLKKRPSESSSAKSNGAGGEIMMTPSARRELFSVYASGVRMGLHRERRVGTHRTNQRELRVTAELVDEHTSQILPRSQLISFQRTLGST